MIRKINLLSILGIVAGVLLLALLCAPSAEPEPSDHPLAAPAKDTPPFADFPLGVARHVSFQIDEAAQSRLTDDEWRDQKLDWLLIAAMRSAGLSPQAMNQALFDVPAIRYGYLKATGNLDYSDTRAAYIGDGRVVALIPASGAAEQMQLLARIADEQRKNRGKIPATILWFAYQLDTRKGDCSLTRQKEIDASTLYAPSSGYFEAAIDDQDSLAGFLAAVGDITYAHLEGRRLHLGGRRVIGSAPGGLTVEDIAALWQSEQSLRSSRHAIAKSAASDDDRPIPDGSGFSLDPQWDFEALSADFPKVAEGLRRWSKEDADVTEEDIAGMEKGVRSHDVTPLFRMINKQRHRNEIAGLFLAKTLQEFIYHHGYQQARYDGALRGTEVGMTLFYTDLLAKVWSMDWKKTAPDLAVQGFVKDPAVVLAPIYKHEIEEFPAVREWFGPRNQGFQVAGGGLELLFAPNATHLYAASSDPAEPGREVTAAFFFAVGIDWWDNHYEEVARYEPQYSRLNQIMKVSIVLSWLAKQYVNDQLRFLETVAVRHDRWFPDWMTKHPELRFRLNDQVGFYPRRGSSPEAMPLLYTGMESGGVSLAPEKLIAERAALPEVAGDKLIQRSYLDYSMFGEESTLKTLDGVTFALESPRVDSALLRAVLPGETKMRAVDAELAQVAIERRITALGRGVSIQTKVGTRDLGELEITAKNQMTAVAWKSRDLDDGQALARQLSQASDWDAILADQKMAEVAVRLGERDYLVKLRGSERWMRLSAEKEPAEVAVGGVESRVAAPDADAQSIQVAWLDDDKVSAELSARSSAVIEPIAGKDAVILRYEGGRAPPADACRLEIRSGDQLVKGWIDSDRVAIHLDVKDLPAVLRKDPVALRQWLGPTQLQLAAKERMATPRGPIRLALSPPGNRAFLRSVGQGDFAGAARAIAADPHGSRTALDAELGAALRQNDELRAGGWQARALDQIDELIALYGERSDLLLRKGLAEFGRNDSEAAAEALNAATRGPLHDPGTFYDEVKAQIYSARRPQVKEAEYRAAELVDWTSAQRQRMVPPGRVEAVAHRGRLVLEYHVDGEIGGSPVTADQLHSIGKTAAIYVQDSPAMANFDWSAAAHASLEHVVRQELATVIQLPRGDIAHFSPAVVYASRQGTAIKAVNIARLSQVQNVPSTYEPYCHKHPCPEAEATGVPIYLVLAAPPAAQKVDGP